MTENKIAVEHSIGKEFPGWFSMVLYGSLWFSMVLYGSLWFSMVLYGYLNLPYGVGHLGLYLLQGTQIKFMWP